MLGVGVWCSPTSWRLKAGKNNKFGIFVTTATSFFIISYVNVYKIAVLY